MSKNTTDPMNWEDDIGEPSYDESQINDELRYDGFDEEICETCGKVECSCDDDYEQWKANEMADMEKR